MPADFRPSLPPPTCLALLLAERLQVDPSDRWTLTGLFTRLFAASLPLKIARFVVFAEVTSTRGRLPYRFQLVPFGEDVILSSTVMMAEASGPVDLIQFQATLENSVFPDYGVYSVQLFAGDDFLIERRLYVAPKEGTAGDMANPFTDGLQP